MGAADLPAVTPDQNRGAMRAKKAWWLLVPATGAVGALFLPTPDEFAFLEGGTPIPVEEFLETRDDWRRIYPLPGAQERAWGFRGRADAVEQAVGRRLDRPHGWESTGNSTINDVDSLGRSRVARTTRLYENVDTGGVAVFVRYTRPGNGPTCAVIVREPRDAWGRIKHMGRRMVAR